MGSIDIPPRLDIDRTLLVHVNLHLPIRRGEECVAIYESLGMDLNTAFRMFMERTRMVRGLPFPAVLPETLMTRIEAQRAIDDFRAEATDLPEMSLDEINAEIRASRAERKVIIEKNK